MSGHHAFSYFGMASSSEAEHRPGLTSSISSPSIFNSSHYAPNEQHHPHQHQQFHIDNSYAQQQQQQHQAVPETTTRHFYEMDDSQAGSMEQYHQQQQQQHSHFLGPSSSASSSRHGEESSSSSGGGGGGGAAINAGGGSTSGSSQHILPAGLPTHDASQRSSSSSSSAGRTSVASLTKGISRARVNMACVHCRTRKIRCDGTQPSCSTCMRLNRSCTYESISEEDNASVREKKRRSRELKQARLNALSNISVAPAPHGRRHHDQPPHTAHFTGSGMMPPSSKVLDSQVRRHSASSGMTQIMHPMQQQQQQQQQHQYAGMPGPSVLREGRGSVSVSERHSPYPFVSSHRQQFYTSNVAPPPLPSPSLSQSTSSPVLQHHPQQQQYHQQQPMTPQRAWQSQVPSSATGGRYEIASPQSIRRRADTVGGYDDNRPQHDQVLAWRGQLSSSSGDGLLHGDLAASMSASTPYGMMPQHVSQATDAPPPQPLMGVSQPATPEGTYTLQAPALSYDLAANSSSGGSVEQSPGQHEFQFWRWSGGGGAAPPSHPHHP